MKPVLRFLEICSVLELLSVGLLLANLATVHDPGLAAALGPIHGALYLLVAVTAVFARNLLRRTRWQALIPVVGGVLTLVNVRREARR